MSLKQDLIDGEISAAQERARMGAKKYDEWVQSQQAYLYSIFESLEELEKFLKQAGYDLTITNTPNYRYIKTHFGNGKWDYYFWFQKGKYLVANYNIGDDMKLIRKFVETVEKSLGKKCFFDSEKERNMYIKSLAKKGQETPPEPSSEVIEPEPEYTFPTIFTDTSVLKYALKNSGISSQIKGDNFEFTLDGFSASIYKSGGSNYEFKIVGKCDLEKIHKYFSKIETEYNKIVQHNICENIKSKVKKSPSMQLEQEEILEDNSVLLTIRI